MVILCIKEVNGDKMSNVLHVDIITLYNYNNNIIRNVSSDNRNLCAGGVWVGNPGYSHTLQYKYHRFRTLPYVLSLRNSFPLEQQ